MNLAELKTKALAATPGPWDYVQIKGFPTIDQHDLKIHKPWFDMCSLIG